jgi:hypothetical protein
LPPTMPVTPTIKAVLGIGIDTPATLGGLSSKFTG